MIVLKEDYRYHLNGESIIHVIRKEDIINITYWENTKIMEVYTKQGTIVCEWVQDWDFKDIIKQLK